MPQLEIDREIAASAERVWEVMTDFERWEEVVTAIKKVERLDDGEAFGPGTRWRETRVMLGREATEEMEITAFDAGRSYTAEAESRGVHYHSEMGVEATGDGTSRIWMTFSGEPATAGGKLLAATVGRLFQGATRKALAKDLDDIAAAAERTTA